MAVAGVIGALSSAGQMTSALSSAFKALTQVVSSVGKAIGEFIGKAIQFVKDKWGDFTAAFGTFTDTIGEIAGSIMDAFGAAWEFTKAQFQAALDLISAGWNGFLALFDFDIDWATIFTIPEIKLPDAIQGVLDLFKGEGVFAGLTLSERLDFAFNLPDWLVTTMDFIKGDGVFAGFSLGERIDLMIGALPQPLKFIADLFQGLFSISIGDFMDLGIKLSSKAWKFIKKIVNDPKGTFASVGRSIVNLFEGVGETLGNILKAPINFLIGALNSLFASINFTKTIDLPGLDPIEVGLNLSNWQIPMLAKGGIVTGPTLAMIGEAGPEAVIPLSGPNSKGMGQTFNININMSGFSDRSDKRNFARRIGNLIQNEVSRNIGGTTRQGRY
tara:strand:+ start:805 stop:1962 length:1158 start_codon:yes stop_codon:yes gene_type:complete